MTKSPLEKYAHKLVKKIRFRIPDVPGAFGQLASVLGEQGAVLGDIVTEHVTSNYIIRVITIFFDTKEQFNAAVSAAHKLKGYKILDITDEVLELHKGGKIGMAPRVRMETLSALRMIYTPGVAQVCRYIQLHPQEAMTYTSIGNTVCIATNGTAVLGLGDIGVLAAMPVMEGKSMILNKFSGVSCVPLLLESRDPKSMVDALALLSKTFSAIMLEDISAPLCFEIETALQERVNIPVFHDDQHGTAVVILAALLKALKITGKKKQSVRLVINGAGAAGMAACKLLLEYGFKNITLCDRGGAIYAGRPNGMNSYKESIAAVTNKNTCKGSLGETLKGADIFIGVSSAGIVNQAMIKSMASKAVVFSLANPVPEIWPQDALDAGAAIAMDGRTINNALAFPGLIKGALHARAPRITSAMKFAAAETLASLSGKNDLVPNFMDMTIHEKIAEAVAGAV
ncbi:MAG: malic enzyme-like NAD(P)-binding protein [Candidatus Omnitrophota bacterium]